MKISKKLSMIAAAVTFSLVAVAAVISIDEVNKTVAGVLAPFNTNTTTAEVVFSKLNIDAIRTVDFGLKALFHKVGSVNELNVQIDDLNYAFGDGTHPTVRGQAHVDLNLIKYFGQVGVNRMAKELNDDIKDMLSEYVEKYGAALTIHDTSGYDQSVVDANGDVVSFRKKLSADVDLTKLPASTPIEKVEFTSINLSIEGTRNGLTGKGEMVLNPKHYSFQAGKDGLKEYIEKLLSKDNEAYQEIAMLIQFADEYANAAVEKEFKPEPVTPVK